MLVNKTPVPTRETDAAAIIRGWVADAELDGASDVYSGKRRWPRIKWQVPVMIETLTTGQRQTSLFVTSRDISEGGIGVWCNQPVEPGTMIRLFVDDGEEHVEGRVRQCTETVGGFIIGVEFRQDK
ncbi:MAG: PilZ domain-containing protein [Phycisphaerales bacterium]|nr:MAG: PilZ domain-containing protein [Phycisphaerales bacterium]